MLNQRKLWIAVVLFVMSFALGDAQDYVGTMDALSSVSAAGSYNYVIPIKVADGCSSFSPKLSLVYDSQGGNGPIGVGWSLSELQCGYYSHNSMY